MHTRTRTRMQVIDALANVNYFSVLCYCTSLPLFWSEIYSVRCSSLIIIKISPLLLSMEEMLSMPVYMQNSQSSIMVCYVLDLNSNSFKTVINQRHETDFIQIILFTKSIVVFGMPKSQNYQGKGNTLLR